VVAGQLVQVPRRVRLGSQDDVEAIGCQRLDHAVVQHARGVHHARHRTLGRHTSEQFRQGVTVGHIAGDDVWVGSQRGEFGDQFRHPVGLVTATAGQQQVAHAVFGHQMPCYHSAETAGPTGDQHRALGVPGQLAAGNLHPRQPGREQRPVTNDQLRFM